MDFFVKRPFRYQGAQATWKIIPYFRTKSWKRRKSLIKPWFVDIIIASIRKSRIVFFILILYVNLIHRSTLLQHEPFRYFHKIYKRSHSLCDNVKLWEVAWIDKNTSQINMSRWDKKLLISLPRQINLWGIVVTLRQSKLDIFIASFIHLGSWTRVLDVPCWRGLTRLKRLCMAATTWTQFVWAPSDYIGDPIISTNNTVSVGRSICSKRQIL